MKTHDILPELLNEAKSRLDTYAKEKAAANRAKAAANRAEARANRLAAHDALAARLKPLAAKTQPGKMDSIDIFRKVEDVVSSCFPDGDPIDHLGPWMSRTGVTIEQINAAVNKHANTRGGLYNYVGRLWKDCQSDAIHDARNGHIDDDSVFYTVDDDGKIIPSENPWR